MPRLLACAVLLSGLAASSVALAGRPYVAIEQRLSSEQMHATGLDQLNLQQLSLLNQLLRDDAESIAAESAAAGRGGAKREAPAPIRSRLTGEFKGWETGTVFKLDNGQRWRVVEGQFSTTRHVSDPDVTVRPGFLGSWYMQVEGIAVDIKVKRIDD